MERRIAERSLGRGWRPVALGVAVLLLGGCAGGGDPDSGGAPVTPTAAADTGTTGPMGTTPADPMVVPIEDPAGDPDGVGDANTVEVGDSAVDPRVEAVDPCQLLDTGALAALGQVGEPIGLEDGRACGLENAAGERVALAVVRSDGITFLTAEEASRADSLPAPTGAVWVTNAPVVESDLLVVEVGAYAELVVEVSAADRSVAERRSVAVAVAEAAIERFAEVPAP